MALEFSERELYVLASALEMAREVFRMHQRSEEIWLLDGFAEYGGRDRQAEVEAVLTKIEDAIGVSTT